MMATPIGWHTTFWVVLGLVSLFLSAVYSGFETGSYRLSEVRLRLEAKRAGGWWRRLQTMLRQRDRYICVLLIGNNVANYGTTAAATTLLMASGFSARYAELYTTLAVTPTLFVIGEMVPKTLFQRRADTLTVKWAWLLSVSQTVFTATGLVHLIRGATTAVLWLFGRRGHAEDLFGPRERIRTLLLDQQASGVLSKTQFDVARNVLELGEVRAGEAMTPIGRVVMVDDRADRRRVEEAAGDNEFSRFVVHAASDRLNILGYIRVNEVLLHTESDELVTRRLHEAVRIPADQPVTLALRRLQAARCPLGIVVNHRGRAVGLVTQKDLAEEIIGELTTSLDTAKTIR